MRRIRKQIKKMLNKNVVLCTGAPRSATRSLAYYLREFGFEHSYHEKYPVISKKFSLQVYNKYDPMELKGNSRPTLGAIKKANILENFFRKSESDHFIDVCWMNSYAMVPLSRAFPNCKWILIYRPVEEVANSMHGFLSDMNFTWPLDWCGNFWIMLWEHILDQLPYIDQEILLVRFDRYIEGKENKRMADFLGVKAPKGKPEDINKDPADYVWKNVPNEIIEKGKQIEQEAMKYYA